MQGEQPSRELLMTSSPGGSKGGYRLELRQRRIAEILTPYSQRSWVSGYELWPVAGGRTLGRAARAFDWTEAGGGSLGI